MHHRWNVDAVHASSHELWNLDTGSAGNSSNMQLGMRLQYMRWLRTSLRAATSKLTNLVLAV